MTANLLERTLEFDSATLAQDLFGPDNGHLKLLAKKSGVDVQSRGTTLYLRAATEEKLNLLAEVLIQFYGVVKAGLPLFERDLVYGYTMLRDKPGTDLTRLFKAGGIAAPKKNVVPKTLNQRDYLAAIEECDLTFGVGPAGTGKTYLAVAKGLSYLLDRKVKRIVLTRPAVEAGEKLGFLPGDMAEKINPYLRPLYDALHDMHDVEKVGRMMETGVIEIAPLAFMRGRTLNDAFIILDEAQNTTPEQMKMFLTRLGFGSKAVVTGDVTQIDLPGIGGRGGACSSRSGLVQAMRVLRSVEGLRFIQFGEKDVIRHPLVARIVNAYERTTETASEANC